MLILSYCGHGLKPADRYEFCLRAATCVLNTFLPLFYNSMLCVFKDRPGIITDRIITERIITDRIITESIMTERSDRCSKGD